MTIANNLLQIFAKLFTDKEQSDKILKAINAQKHNMAINVQKKAAENDTPFALSPHTLIQTIINQLNTLTTHQAQNSFSTHKNSDNVKNTNNKIHDKINVTHTIVERNTRQNLQNTLKEKKPTYNFVKIENSENIANNSTNTNTNTNTKSLQDIMQSLFKIHAAYNGKKNTHAQNNTASLFIKTHNAKADKNSNSLAIDTQSLQDKALQNTFGQKSLMPKGKYNVINNNFAQTLNAAKHHMHNVSQTHIPKNAVENYKNANAWHNKNTTISVASPNISISTTETKKALEETALKIVKQAFENSINAATSGYDDGILY